MRLCFLLLLLTLSSPVIGGDAFIVLGGKRPADPKEVARLEFQYGMRVLYEKDVKKGQGPVRIEGTVWHLSLDGAKAYLGTRNPALVTSRAGLRMYDDKWQEFVLLSPSLGENYPRTKRIADIMRGAKVPPLSDEAAVLDFLYRLDDRLKEEFPNGYVIKDVSSYGTSGKLITDRVFGLRYFYEHFRETINEALVPRHQIETLFKIITDPRRVIVQERLRIGREYRVHAIDGKVVKGLTADRYFHIRSSKAKLEEIEGKAQSLLNRLPEELRNMSYAFDLAEDNTGKLWVVEGNLGGDSGFFDPEVSLLTTQRLARYLSGKAPALLSAFEKVLDCSTIGSSRAAMISFVGDPGLREHGHGAATWNFYCEFLDHIFAIAERKPSKENIQMLVDTLVVFSLERFLTKDQHDFLRSHLGKGGAGSLERLARTVVCNRLMRQLSL